MYERKIFPKKKSNGLIVITGCDTGIGRSLAKSLLQEDYTLVLSYLEKNPFATENNVYTKKMDLRKQEDVHDFCRYVNNLCREDVSLKGVILNAGVALGGPVENLPLAFYRECFEINYFGTVAIIQAMIPALIRDKGRIMVIGSMAGRIALPFLSPYASTKFALEGFCDSLRREMNPFGIKTILIEPAAVATPIWNKAKQQDISFVDEKYRESLDCFRENFIEDGNRGMDTDVAGAMIADIFLKKCPQARYIITKNSFMSKLMLLLPSCVIDKAVGKIFKMDYGSKDK